MNFLKENMQFTILTLIWVVLGILVDKTVMVLAPAALLLFRQKGFYTEIIMTQVLINYLSDNRHWEFSFATLGKDIVLVTAAAFVILNPKNFPQRSKIFYPFLPFFLLAFILCWQHPEPVHSFQKTLSFFLMVAIVPNYFLRQLQVEGPTYLRKIIWLGTILYVIALVMMVVLPEDWTFLEGRYNGLLGNPNGVGTWSTMFFIFIYMSLRLYPQLLSRNEKFLVFGSLIISVLLASSRNCIFSIAIFLFFSRFYKISPWLGFVIVIVVALLYQIINENLAYIITSLGLAEYMRLEHLNDGSGRLIAWTFAWDQIQKNYFLLGRGFAFEEWLFKVNQDWLNVLGHQGGVHNTYLAVWLNTGIIGLCCYLFGLFYNFVRAARRNHMAFPVLFAIMFSITFEAWFQASLNPFTIIALMVITLLQYDKPVETEEKSTVPVL